MSTQPRKQSANEPLDLLQGTLDLLILRTLIFGSQHGQGIARAIQQTSEQELLVEHGALYPALQRLEERGWIAPIASDDRRQPYTITALGRRHLEAQVSSLNAVVKAAQRRLKHA